MKYTAILKLKQMLDEAKIPYQSFDDDLFGMKEKGIPSARFNPAYCLQLNKNIDVIQHCGSYGNEQDLLEIQGALTVEEREQSSVLGHLTAEEVFKRFKYCYEHNTAVYSEESKEKDTIHSHAPKFKKDIPMPPVKPAPTANCNKELKMRENELHEPKIETLHSYEHTCILTYCNVCGNPLMDTDWQLKCEKDLLAMVIGNTQNYCPHCGARLKEVDE